MPAVFHCVVVDAITYIPPYTANYELACVTAVSPVSNLLSVNHDLV